MNSETSRFGPEFHYEIVSILKQTGGDVYWHDASACITPEPTEAESLQKAWRLVQDIAIWLKNKLKEKPEIEHFRIIVGWSKQTRKLQGQIFKIWKTNNELDLIISCNSLEEYRNRIADVRQAPFEGWQRDVFHNEEA